jgi:tetratricopeptide (TPR) repeat protein
MRALKFVPAACLVACLLPFGHAGAVTIVLGGGAAAECYGTAEYGDPYTAFDVCSRALQGQQLSVRDLAATYINRSVVRLRVRDYQGAVNDCDQSISRYPRFGEAYVNRGAALLNMEKPQEALVELNKAIDLGLDKLHLAYYNRALAKEKLHDALGAYLDYKKSLELDPNFTLAADQLKRFTVVNGKMQVNS